MIDIKLQKSLSGLQLNIAFCTSKTVIGLHGASGSGKTSILNMISGLIKPDFGHIKLNNNVLFDGDQRINIAPHKRNIGYIFQDPRLFPHLNVEQNLFYGQRIKKLKKDTTDIIQMLDIEKLLPRTIHHLSGGEKQRVAIGRALFSDPKLLLLDEPMSSLDEKRKSEILPYLLHLRQTTKIPMIYVSHNMDELNMLADTVVEICEGSVS
jgi:molybdate transport system ATP-binding protein